MARYAYVRISTDKQDYDAQVNTIKSRYEIDYWVMDTGTGKITQPNLQKLSRAVKKGDEVIVYAFDRLGRSTSNVIAMVDMFKRRNAAVISIREGVDLNSASGNMVFQMMCSIAEFEANLISDRVKQGLKAAVQRGVKLGAPKRFDDETHKKVEVICQNYRKQGLSYKKMIVALKEEHNITASHGLIYNMLNPEYAERFRKPRDLDFGFISNIDSNPMIFFDQ